jgi:heparan-alpha-glucosaminide N-acetyltransferase
MTKAPLANAASTAARPQATGSIPVRLTSLDAYRGFVMFLMMAEVLRLPQVAGAFPTDALWQFIKFNTSHVQWVGCSLHDLIQPSFSFMVGVALPYSIASRVAKGQSFRLILGHAAWRAVLLVLLGVFLRSLDRPQTYWTLEDTLSQIGLGYFFLVLLGFRSLKAQAIALAVILAGYWAAFALYPLPGAGFEYGAVGVPAEWREGHLLSGFAAHWNKNSNFAWAADQWILNLFPREKPFVYNGGGYATLSFIPTLATMILGSIAGNWLRTDGTPAAKLRLLAGAGVAGLVLGGLLHWTGVCPLVKRVWTPSFTLYSGGWCFLLLAGFYAVIDVWNCKRLAFPLVVIGMNSIAIYCMVGLFEGSIIRMLQIHLGEGVFRMAGPVFEPVLLGAGAMLTLWLILYWMYRRKIFLKV